MERWLRGSHVYLERWPPPGHVYPERFLPAGATFYPERFLPAKRTHNARMPLRADIQQRGRLNHGRVDPETKFRT
ncbi:hypothetical protein AAVH_33298, partial [Aphelenchoides avenae]